MRKALYISLFLLTTLAVQAQSSQRAKNYLTEVNRTINTYKNVSITFTYTQTDKSTGDKSNNYNGSVDLQKDLYNLNFLDVQRIYDGKKIYTISEEEKEVTIQKHDPNANDGLLPSQILTFFNTGYNLSWDITQKTADGLIQYIKLTPTDKKASEKEILLGIKEKDKSIYKRIQLNKDGSKSILTVNSFKTNQPLSKNHFTFTASNYSDYYINNID